MKRITFKIIMFFVFLQIVCFLGFSQNIYTSDGVYLGDKSQMIKECVEGAGGDVIDFYGMEIDTKYYCECIIENIFVKATSDELKDASRNNALDQLLLSDKYYNNLAKCMQSSFSSIENIDIPEEQFTEFTIQGAITICVRNILNSPFYDETWTEEVAEHYCSCVVPKLQNKGFNYSDIVNMQDENSTIYNEIVVPCLNSAMNSLKNQQFSNLYEPSDIIGYSNSISINLIDYINQGYKLKINIGGVEKYFLFDTGASDIVISENLEKELLEKGIISMYDYVGTTEYTTANNQKHEAKIVVIDNIKLGSYTLNNVFVSIVKNGKLLCGKGLLDKFSNWEFNAKDKTLTLYK